MIEEETRVDQLVERALTLLWAGRPLRETMALLASARVTAVTPVASYHVGEALLRASGARQGWDLYDLHPSRSEDTLPRVARWDGRFCDQLVVVAEQGFGDTIQFLRYIPAVASNATKVTFAVHDALHSTVTSSPILDGVDVVTKSAARASAWPATARWERLMSLPVHQEDPGARPVGPYVVPRQNGPPRLGERAAGLTIGIAWRSTPRRGFPNRSVPARLLAGALKGADRRLVCLHRDRDVRAVPGDVDVVGVRDLADTACVIRECDYVVTADTVTAHLAPALGVPTIVCLRHRPDWRWGSPARPTRWYASAEAVFDTAEGKWIPAVEEAAERIAARWLPDISQDQGP